MASEALPSSTADPEAAYYQTVEEYFVSRRGDPLTLSNADWHRVHTWRKAGIPLRIVLRGIADALDSHAHSWGRHRKVRSLGYCAAEVDVAIDRWKRALQGGEEEAGEAAFLDRLMKALREARDLGPGTAEEVRGLLEDLGAPGGPPTDPERLEAWLRSRERVLLDRVTQETLPDVLAGIEGEVDRDLAPYRERMPRKVLDQVRQESLARRLLERHGLPRLSLFHS